MVIALAPALFAAGKPVSFSKDIQPVLEASCWKCHGAAIQLSKLDLRTREATLKGGEKGPSIVPGNAEQSKLYRLIAGLEKPAMPMDGRLAAGQIEAFKLWIDQGAQWDAAAITSLPKDASAQMAALEEMQIPPEARNYWAFRKPVRHPVPTAGNSRNPIDRFLERVRREKGVTAAPRADSLTLVRRAYLDLIGLPPSPAQAEEFLKDQAPGAWDRLIERLLASPHYGERWGRHWLDVARYADSNGFEHDFNRPNAWRYRDYVIGALNKDTPYNVFLAEQIAGDEIDWVTDETLIATGFLRNYAKIGFREKDNPQYRYEYLDDMIATIGRGVLGLTVQCARCHNHKFDPIPHKDYYRMQASLFGYVEVDHPLTSRAEAEAYEKKLADMEARVAPLKERIREMEEPYRLTLAQKKYKRFPENIQRAIAVPEEKRTPGEALLANQVIRTTAVASTEIDRVMTPADLAEKNKLGEELKRIEGERPKPIPMAMGITDGDYRFTPDGAGDEPAPGKGIKQGVIEGSFLHRGEGRYQPPPSYFLIRGDVESRGSLMKPGFVTVATLSNPPVEIPPANGHTSGRRRALAEWLGSSENPLTARVIVNRIWHHHFGRGIVPSLDNFGKMGEPATHPELLDWLAVEFMQRGWSIKQMHRLLMTSDAYQMSSQYAGNGEAEKDPDNAYLWRFRIQRLEAEIVRDSVMAASGSLDLHMGGPAIFPHLSDETLAVSNKGVWDNEEDGPKVWRRSVYVYRKRGLPFPMFEVFDLPDQNISCGRRNVSTVPTQALTLLNNEFVLKQARHFAGRVKEAAPGDASQRVDLAYRIALTRTPSDKERDMALEFLKTQSFEDFAHVLLNLNEFLYVR
ncbi:MAG: PSD1 and planctomycete cytochrome C domain-containing protein [Bryobacteraceae bacterium]